MYVRGRATDEVQIEWGLGGTEYQTSEHPSTHRIGALTRAFATGWSGRPGAASSKDDIRPGKFLYVLGAIRALLPAGANQRGPALGLAASPLVLERLAAIQRDARAALIRAGGLAD